MAKVPPQCSKKGVKSRKQFRECPGDTSWDSAGMNWMLFVPPGKHPEKLGGSAESLIPGFQPTQGDAFATSSFSAGTG